MSNDNTMSLISMFCECTLFCTCIKWCVV